LGQRGGRRDCLRAAIAAAVGVAALLPAMLGYPGTRLAELLCAVSWIAMVTVRVMVNRDDSGAEPFYRDVPVTVVDNVPR
jgi:hypothetical protein